MFRITHFFLKLIKSFPITPEIWRPYRRVWFWNNALIVVNQYCNCNFGFFLSSHSTCANLIANNFWHEFIVNCMIKHCHITKSWPKSNLDRTSAAISWPILSCVRRHHPTTSQDMTLMKYTDGNYLIINGLLLSPPSIIRICEDENWFQQTLEDWKSITKRLQNP